MGTLTKERFGSKGGTKEKELTRHPGQFCRENIKNISRLEILDLGGGQFIKLRWSIDHEKLRGDGMDILFPCSL